MCMDNKSNLKRVLFTMITAFCVGFIFSRSLMPGNKSGEESSKILMILNSISEFFGFGTVFTHNFVRKCAHFTEFAILALMAFNMYKSYALKIKMVALLTVCSYFLVAMVDETIQFFVPGRACQFTDVIIDFTGGTLGMIICIVIYFFVNRRKKFIK